MDCSMNIITANFSGGRREARTARRHQWDRGQVLCVTGIEDLPLTFQVHFAVHRQGGSALQVDGIDGQVDIPNILLTFGRTIYAWIYLNDSASGETVYTITIPIIPRPMPEYYDLEDTGVFDRVVEQVGEYAEQADQSAQAASQSASGASGSASEAAGSASAAESAKTAAETAQGKAEDAQAAAETAAQTATQKAEQTEQDAAQTAQSKADAESAADRAEAAQTGAESAKTGAETAAQGAADSASAASASATEAGQAASAAAQSATAAAQSAASIEGDVQTASQKAAEATVAAGQAVAAKDAAQTAQTGAETAATNAGQSASTATTKAAEAAQSAANAAQSKTDAEAAAARAEQAAASLTVDDALSDTSTNPVQNKVVTGALKAKQNAPSAAGTAGQVLGLDSNLNPVWVDQSGGGGGETWHEATLSEADYDSTLKMILFDAGSGNQVKDVILMGQIVNDGTQTASEKIVFGIGNTANRINYSTVGQTNDMTTSSRRVGFTVQFSVRYIDSTRRTAFPQVLLYGNSGNANFTLNPDMVLTSEGTKRASNFYHNFNDPRYVKIELPTWIPIWAYIKVLYTLA